MQNIVKENWKRRICSTGIIFIMTLFFMVGWATIRYFGISFSHALKVHREEVDRIVINNKVYRDEEEVTELFDYICNFRYSQGWPLPLEYGNRSRCEIEKNVVLVGPNLSKGFTVWNNGIIMDDRWYEWRDNSECYFAPILE